MNKRELSIIEKKARRVATNHCEVLAVENKKGRVKSYLVNVDGELFGGPKEFYGKFPEVAPRERRTVYGPYRAKNIGVGGDVWEVVCMVDNHSNTWEELRPRVTYAGEKKRAIAHAKCLRLNKRWNQDMLESMDFDMIEYWEKATN